MHKPFRIIYIILINLLVIGWLIVIWAQNPGWLGVIGMFVFFFLVVYNLYSSLVYLFFKEKIKKQSVGVEIKYALILLIPFALLFICMLFLLYG